MNDDIDAAEATAADLAELRSDRDDLDREIAEKEADLASATATAEDAGDAPTSESPAPTDHAGLVAEINRLDAEGKHAEAAPLKSRLLGLRSGFPPPLSQTPAADVAEPTAAELSAAVTTAEAAGDQKTASALKSQWLRSQGHGQ